MLELERSLPAVNTIAWKLSTREQVEGHDEGACKSHTVTWNRRSLQWKGNYRG